MKLRTGDSWTPAPDYGKSLKALNFNLLVRDVTASLPFHIEVLAAEIVYADPDIAVFRGRGSEWMLHADHTYRDHPLHGSLTDDTLVRGIGAEIRLHGRDPNEAEAKARELDYTVLAGAVNKPHGLREAFILDTDGY